MEAARDKAVDAATGEEDIRTNHCKQQPLQTTRLCQPRQCLPPGPSPQQPPCTPPSYPPPHAAGSPARLAPAGAGSCSRCRCRHPRHGTLHPALARCLLSGQASAARRSRRNTGTLGGAWRQGRAPPQAAQGGGGGTKAGAQRTSHTTPTTPLHHTASPHLLHLRLHSARKHLRDGGRAEGRPLLRVVHGPGVLLLRQRLLW